MFFGDRIPAAVVKHLLSCWSPESAGLLVQGLTYGVPSTDTGRPVFQKYGSTRKNTGRPVFQIRVDPYFKNTGRPVFQKYGSTRIFAGRLVNLRVDPYFYGRPVFWNTGRPVSVLLTLLVHYTHSRRNLLNHKRSSIAHTQRAHYVKWRRINVDATWLRRIDVDTTSIWHQNAH